MPRKPNEPMGVCPCPHAGCSAKRAPIFRFKDTATAGGKRKAGKVYGRCPTHGWFGYDAAPAVQTYIRANGTLNEGESWGSEESSGEPANAATNQEPAPKPEASDSSTAQSSRTPKSQPAPSSKSPAALPAATASGSTSTAKPATRPAVWDL